MTRIAIIIGNAHYKRLSALECCLEDLKAIENLVASIGHYDVTKVVADADADTMRKEIRGALSGIEVSDEVLFYFSGHGAQIGNEFYFCGTGFDVTRPNETGMAHGALFELLRASGPELLVTIFDACASGAPLIKSAPPIIPVRKDGFRNVVQLSSCMTDQYSYTGDPLSEFTGAFLDACLHRDEGPIYYSDIANTLRDNFLQNESQTPFFVYQGTGRELLVGDAAGLEPFRNWFYDLVGEPEEEDGEISQCGELLAIKEPTILDLLSRAERKMVTPEKAERLISSLLDGVSARLAASELSDLFEVVIQEHATFQEKTAHDFIARTLAREPRPDDMVHATVRRGRRDDGQSTASMAAMMALGTLAALQETVDLELNCSLARAQMKATFTPKYQSLQRMVLVLSCAPSLERCYVFEMLTRHQRSDWNRYEAHGGEVVKRWYKLDWEEDTGSLVEKICGSFEEAVRSHIEATTSRLAAD